MGVRLASSSNNTLVTSNLPNAAETIFLQTGLIGLAQDNALVIIIWYAVISVGAGATGITIRLRRGSALTSTLVNVASNTSVTASTQVSLAGTYTDTPGVLGQVQYSLSALVAGGAVAGTAGDGSLAAMVL